MKGNQRTNQDLSTEYQRAPSSSTIPLDIHIPNDGKWNRQLVFIDMKTGERYTTMTETRVSFFREALERIHKIHEQKAADYTDSGEFGNFVESAKSADIEVYQAIENLIGTKEARIRVLRRAAKNGKDGPRNEPLVDSYLDRAVYALIAYAWVLHEHAIVRTSSTFAEQVDAFDENEPAKRYR